MLRSNREKYDVSNADVEAGGDSGENNSDLSQGKDQYSTIFSVLLVDKYTVTVPDSVESAFALRPQKSGGVLTNSTLTPHILESHHSISIIFALQICTECKT